MIILYPHSQHKTEEVVGRCSVKPALLEISKNLQENTEVSFNNIAELQAPVIKTIGYYLC